ncbi:MAG TPA: DUF1592 domain-containing protein [Polyangia bacterium]|nr:DUF1592 domain-containing protein [Polyangia bacterium]
MSACRPRRLRSIGALAPLLLLVACTGEVGPGPGSTGGGAGTSGNNGSGGGGPASNGGIGTVAIENAPDKAISRLTNAQFIQSAAVLVGDAAVMGADALLPEQDRHGAFTNTGYAQDQPFDLIESYDSAASYIVDHVTDWTAFQMRWGGCTQATCVSTFLRSFVEAAFRRPATDADVTAFQPILDASTAAMLPYTDTVKLLVRATLQAPEFLYLFADDMLNDYQLAARLSYFVSNGPPDDQLYAAAKAQTLHIPANLDAQIDRLLAKTVTQFASAFAYDYLDLHRATTRNVTTDPATVKLLISSAVNSFAALVDEDKPISTILTLDTFVTDPATATWTSGQPSTAATVQPSASFPFMGLLTHPATLMAMSNEIIGSTVNRGIFISNQIMCVPPTPPPPPGIQQTDLSAKLPPNPTERDIGEARVADPRCQGCHSQFESYSFPFNRWGGDGLFKTDPTLKDNGPILTGLGMITFKGYADFLPQLAGSTQFQRCVTDQLIRYGLQHTEYPADLVDTVLTEAKKLTPAVTFRSLIKALIRQSVFTTR